MSDQENPGDLLDLTTEIVAAHVSNNSLSVAEVPQLIQNVYKTLAAVGSGQAQAERLQPAVSVKKSVTPDHIICLEDGKKLKMLPGDYPMVAPNYAKHRSNLAKKIGLGTRSRRTPA